MRYVLCTTPGREAFRDYLVGRLHDLIVITDKVRSARETFREALATADSEPTVFLQDDIILTRAFRSKVEQRIAQYGHDKVHQFFSMRRADRTVGTRREPGRTFMMAQCFYLPAGYARNALAFSYVWPGLQKHKAAIDTMLADLMKARRDHYWLHVPSLVQHRPCVSMIDPRRSRGRKSITFEDPDL